MSEVPSSSMRGWLSVPDRFGVPGWARTRLRPSFEQEMRARDGRSLEQTVFGIVDLETTGLSAYASILEIGLVVLRGGRVLCRFTTFVDTGFPVSRFITRLTGIRDEDLVDAPAERQALDGFRAALADTGVDALVAHNARFDHGFLERAWEAHAFEPALPPFLCSIRVARRLVQARRYGLSALVEQLGIPRAERHRALGDAEMTAWLWRELLARARLDGVRTLEGLRRLERRRLSPRGRKRRARLRGSVDASPAIG